jgi:hypothetical protein
MGLSQTLGVGFSLLGNTFGKNSSPQRFGSIQFDGLPVVSVAEKKAIFEALIHPVGSISL